MAQITVELKDDVVQSYLDHYGECVGREINFAELPEEVKEQVLQSIGDEMVIEVEMRTDDHSGFETENYFFGVFND